MSGFLDDFPAEADGRTVYDPLILGLSVESSRAPAVYDSRKNASQHFFFFFFRHTRQFGRRGGRGGVPIFVDRGARCSASLAPRHGCALFDSPEAGEILASFVFCRLPRCSAPLQRRKSTLLAVKESMIILYDEGCLAIAERLRLGVLEESARHSVRRRKAPGARPTGARRARIAKDLGSRVAFGVVVFVGREREAVDILELQTLDPARLDRFKKQVENNDNPLSGGKCSKNPDISFANGDNECECTRMNDE